MPRNSHLNLKIHGRVQGVSFRFYAKKEADKLGVTGFVQNEADGTVFIEAEGEETAISKFVKWCRLGPPGAVVSTVESTEGDFKNFSEFKTQL